MPCNEYKMSVGCLRADNEADPERSVIIIFAPSQRGQRLPRSLLLEIASCINGEHWRPPQLNAPPSAEGAATTATHFALFSEPFHQNNITIVGSVATDLEMRMLLLELTPITDASWPYYVSSFGAVIVLPMVRLGSL